MVKKDLGVRVCGGAGEGEKRRKLERRGWRMGLREKAGGSEREGVKGAKALVGVRRKCGAAVAGPRVGCKGRSKEDLEAKGNADRERER